MKRLIIDLDNTISSTSAGDYAGAEVYQAVRLRMIEYKAMGFEIVIHSARNMRTFAGNIGKINAVTLPTIIEWLATHDIPYDEIIVGKPWCGFDGFYVDDRAVRPDEFVSKSFDELNDIISASETRMLEMKNGGGGK